MIIKYCRHKSDIVVVFETIITSLLSPAPDPPNIRHNGDNEVREDNEQRSAASAVTFLFCYPQPPPLDTPGPMVTRHQMSRTMVTGQTMQIIRAGWSLITADPDISQDSRNITERYGGCWCCDRYSWDACVVLEINKHFILMGAKLNKQESYWPGVALCSQLCHFMSTFDRDRITNTASS